MAGPAQSNIFMPLRQEKEDDDGSVVVRSWWSPWHFRPAPFNPSQALRNDAQFSTPPLQYKKVAAVVRPRDSPKPQGAPAGSRTLYWGISLNSHRAFFQSLLEVVPEADQFFTRFPNATKKSEFHVTLRFVGGAPMSAEEGAQFQSVEGMTVRVEPLVLLVSSKLIALSVRLVDSRIAQMCRNACPHVTIALAPMVKPYQSNEELEALFSGQLQARDPMALPVPVGDGLELVGVVTRFC